MDTNQKPKTVQELASFIRGRGKQAKEAMDASAPKDPDDKGAAGDGANRDEAKTAPSMPKGNESNSPDKDSPKTVENKDVVKSGEGNDATQGVTKVSEPESTAKSAASAIHAVLSRYKKAPEKEASDTDKDKKPEEGSDKKASAEGDDKSKKTDGEPEPKKAGESVDVEFDPSYYVKLAKVVNASEERRAMVAKWAEEDHGVEVAQHIIKAASMTDEELARQEKQAADEEAYFAELNEKIAKLSGDDKEAVEKFAKIQDVQLGQLKTPLEQQAYLLGVKQAAEIMDQGGEMPAESAEPSPEEIMALLEQMVQSGEITPEEAQAIMAELQAGAGAEEMPEEMKAACEQIEKAASLAVA